mmetsp:Transcript_18855/g.22880  ORF Transcript_18855/g.22880 Transcript_18855/m.22880 type:complete len:774 (+) Transcript_18855:1-2322(+)
MILGGGDVLAASPTGSGKTAAFALPIIQLVYESLTTVSEKLKDEEESFGLSMWDRDPNLAVNENQCQSRDVKKWFGVRGNYGIMQGKVYYEAFIEDEGIARIGFSEPQAKFDLGTDSKGYGYGGTGKLVHNGNFVDFQAGGYTKGDVIGCLLDFDLRQIFFSKNGSIISGQYLSLAPSTRVLTPAAALKNAQIKFNFVQVDILYLPRGYTAIADYVHDENNNNNILFLSAQGKETSAATSTQVSKTKQDKKSVLAIILEPSRDLAEQTYDCFENFAKNIHLDTPAEKKEANHTMTIQKIQTRLLIGGCDCRSAERDCEKGIVDIIVATPRKFLDMVKRKKIQVYATQFFVLDEADRYAEDAQDTEIIKEIYSKIPTSVHRSTKASRFQVAFFSATLHSEKVKELIHALTIEPTWIDLKGPDHLPDSVHHIIFSLDPKKSPYLHRLLRTVDEEDMTNRYITDAVHRGGRLENRMQPLNISEPSHITSPCANTKEEDQEENANYSEFIKRIKPKLLIQILDQLELEQILIFCRTNLDCDALEKYLNANNKANNTISRYSCRVLAGGRDVSSRRQALSLFKNGDIKILICTDVAARGIDISGLPAIINLTLPDSLDTYIHRAGRVGRADKIGLAISLVAMCKEQVWFCQKGKKPPQHDTRPYTQGGNTIWYNEPSLLFNIQQRIQKSLEISQSHSTTSSTSITIIQPTDDIVLPKHLQALEFGDSFNSHPGGQHSATSVSSKHISKLSPDVDQLMYLEAQAQTAFFSIQQQVPLSS